jgi:hypothetical protein
MSDPHLPAEMLDHVVDHLHDTQDALRNCCLVSKSWVPRTRRHLFADVRFYTIKSMQSWKEAFTDPSTSPACYAKILFVGHPEVVTVADGEIGGWITCFSRVVRLEVVSSTYDASATPLAPFRGLSPVIKSLLVNIPVLPTSQVSNFILSFPLLEDLAVITSWDAPIDDGDGSDRLLSAAQPPNSPTLSGSLELYLGNEVMHFIRRLLSLPDGIHFRKLTLTWLHEGDHLLTMALIEGCSRTLESLDINYKLRGTSVQYLRPHRQLTFVSR